jgi:RNA polymerase sigma-70 factor (ECF subfamily)
MFRFEELNYAEIAELLNISVRTVEDHLSKSMQFIHAQAKHLIDGKLTNT